jgi:hypothetical protein
MAAAVQLKVGDPLLRPSRGGAHSHGNLVTNGAAYSFSAAMKELIQTYIARPGLAVHPHGLLLHGSTSASLLGVTRNTSGLLPSAQLLAQGIAPMTGELDAGVTPGHVNQTMLSTVFATNPSAALNYTIGEGWTPEVGMQRVAKLSRNDYPADSFWARLIATRKGIEEQRLEFWKRLMPGERALVAADFPVLWRMRPGPHRAVMPVASDVGLEIGMVGGASWPEITSVHVPSQRMREVQDLFDGHGIEIPVSTLDGIGG